MQQINLIQIGVAEFKKLISDAVIDASGLGGSIYLENTKNDEVLSQIEAAKLLKTTPKSLIRYQKEGIIPFHRMPTANGSNRLGKPFNIKRELLNYLKVKPKNAQ